MSISFRHILLGPLLLVAALVVFYPVFWIYMAQQVEEEFARWRTVQEQQGRSVKHGATDVAGFPGVVRLDVEAPEIVSTKDGWRWRGERASFEIQPWDWQRLRIDVSGEQELTVSVEGQERAFKANPEGAYAIGRLAADGQLVETVVAVDGIRLHDEAGAPIVETKAMQAHLRWPEPPVDTGDFIEDTPSPKDPTLDVTLAVSDLRMPSSVQSPLGQEVKTFGLLGRVVGKPPHALRRSAVDEWRRAGGKVELEQFTLVWGDLDLRATGTAALDDAFRPLGAMTAEIRGYRAMLTALEEARLMRRNAAAASRLALDLLSKPDGGDRRVATVPITAQNGSLFVGPVKILKLLPIFPPAPSG